MHQIWVYQPTIRQVINLLAVSAFRYEGEFVSYVLAAAIAVLVDHGAKSSNDGSPDAQGTRPLDRSAMPFVMMLTFLSELRASY